MATVMRQFLDNSYLYGANASFIEELYEKYLVNPQSVPEEWREYFDRIQVLPGNAAKDVAHAPVVESFVQRAKAGQLGGQARTLPAEPVTPERLQVAALLLVTAYRIAGSRWATVDPLKRMPRPSIPELEPGFYDLSEADLDQTVNAGSFVGLDRTSLRNLLQALRDAYCRNIGFEYMFISERAQRQWIQERIEPVRATPEFPPEQKKRLLQKLTEAEQLERYLHTRYVGQKRFSLEGGESLIPSIDELIQRAGGNGVQEIVIGMAHRGRLNVLVNVLGKMPKDLFLEFEGKGAQELPSGDVKYHSGFSSDITTSGGPVHLSLAFNPSHLEIVNPVVEGSVRARQRRRDDKTGDQVLPILVHGDAAFAGQGVVMETLNLSGTRGYGTGGTVHLIVNNQIGFTTSDPRDTRSTIYCTDVAKMVEAPIFHVNGDDPEAVLFITQLALDFRQKFHKDVELLAEIERQLGDEQHRLRVVAVDVEDRRLDHFRHIGAVDGRARVARIGGGEADLVVDDDMHGAAGAEAARARQVQRLHHHALRRECGVAVQENGHHLVAGLVVAPALARPHRALHHRVHDLQVGGIERERDVHRAAARRDVRGEPVVVFHVSGGQLGSLPALELEEQVLRHLAQHVDQHVEPPAVRHADHHLLHAVAAGALDQLVDRRDQALAALQREALLADVAGMQVALELLRLGELLQQALFLLGREVRRGAHRLDALLV